MQWGVKFLCDIWKNIEQLFRCATISWFQVVTIGTGHATKSDEFSEKILKGLFSQNVRKKTIIKVQICNINFGIKNAPHPKIHPIW